MVLQIPSIVWFVNGTTEPCIMQVIYFTSDVQIIAVFFCWSIFILDFRSE
jgi:hypothetical protein